MTVDRNTTPTMGGMGPRRPDGASPAGTAPGARCLNCGDQLADSDLLCSGCGLTNPGNRISAFKVETTKLSLRETFKILKRLFQLGLPYWRFQVLILVLTSLFFFLHLPGPYLNKVLIDQVVITGNRNLVHLILLVEVLIGILVFAFSTIQGFICFYVGSMVERDLHRDLFTRFQKLSASFFDNTPLGETVYTATVSLDQMKYFLLYESYMMLSNIIFVAMGSVILLLVNFKLGLIATITIPLWVLVARGFQAMKIPVEDRIQAQSAGIYSAYSNNITNYSLIRSYAMEDLERRKFFGTIGDFVRTSVERLFLFSLSHNVLANLTMLSSALLMWMGGLAIIDKELTVGGMVAFTSFLAYLWTPTEGLLTSVSDLPPYLLASLRVFQVFDAEKNSPMADGTLDLPEIEGSIEFCEVSFGYQPGQPVIRKLDLVIQPGEKVAIVGPSGSGKTTVVKLLLRYFDVTGGKIFIDGFDILTLKMSSLRQKIGVVLQNQFVFPGTIAENIRYGKPDATIEEVIEAAQNANAHEFINRQEAGYESRLGEEGGISLSGGEAQRIAIARVILKKAPIVILDEATSALDNQTEVLIQGAMDYLMRDRTCLIIAHRLSTIMDADKVCVLKNGQLVQTGKPRQLVEEEGLFADLYHRRLKTDE